jgi:site-specific DNA recombinase
VPRPDFEEMMRLIELGELDGICVWKLDRLLRRFVDLGPILKALAKRHSALISVMEPHIDTTTPIGQAVVGFLAAQAEEESRSTSARVSAKEAARAKSGLIHGGGHRCFGYSRAGEVIDSEADTIRWMVEALTSGSSLRSIVRYLNEQRVLTTAGKPWESRTVAQLLRSPRIYGVRVHRTPLPDGSSHERRYPGSWEAILSDLDFPRIDALLSRGYSRSKERVANRYLLTGLLYCGACGRKLVVGGQRVDRDHQHLYYRCSKPPGLEAIGHVAISVDGANRFVIRHVLSNALASGNASSAARRQEEDEVRAIEQEHVDANQQYRALLSRRVKSKDPAILAELDLQLDIVGAEMEALLVQIGERRARLVVPVDLGHWRKGISQSSEPFASNATTDEKRAIIGAMIERIDVQPASRKGAKFDSSRIAISWRSGFGYDVDDSDASEQLNMAEGVLDHLNEEGKQ